MECKPKNLLNCDILTPNSHLKEMKTTVLGLHELTKTSGHWVGSGQELMSVYGSMGIGGSIGTRGKVLCLAYKRYETPDKRPLDRDPTAGVTIILVE